MMRPSSVVLASLLALFLLITGAQGIRFKIGGLLSFGHDHHLKPAEIHELKKMMKISHEDGSVIGESITGMIMNRKLITTTTTTSETNIGENKANPRVSSSKSKSSSDDGESNSPPPATTSSEHSSDDEISHDHHHVDITDITEMDYSPARRKPPIHN
ncbi:hypothetical protein LWI28_019210 [Acer negundo]|uniref:Uncharacterized protein n=1 Tax=Acer negundo TaxID=4023 RepID=A0AAD5JAP4_ACENE|nr:hypothetical protein LWI28_019210 [Acer negundo]KAK4853207.1 hypothetical protein QYF36_005329 [Acer negundo]